VIGGLVFATFANAFLCAVRFLDDSRTRAPQIGAARIAVAGNDLTFFFLE